MNETLPIKRTTLTEMVVAYRQSEQEIREAFRLIEQATERLHSAFQTDYRSTFDIPSEVDYAQPDKVMLHMKHSAWKILVGKMGVRSAMSLKRAAELDEQLEGRSRMHGRPVESLPEITEVNILAMMETTMQSIPAMIEEAVKEIYEWLRPSGWMGEYKTNKKNEWALKDKVILSYAVAPDYAGGMRVSHHRQQNITALDNVFRMLDGKGPVETHYGPLTDAICAAKDRTGTTDYFEFKCFRNQNLHLKFTRPDLVAKLNAVAGGMRLGNARKEAA